MTRPIRLGMVVPDISDPTSYYRAIGPFSLLQKQMPELEFCFLQHPATWPTLRLCDMVFMQRPFNPEHWNTMVRAKDEGLPVWIDFDDDNLSVRKDNPVYPIYKSEAIKDSIVKLARFADVITVSTEKLKEKFRVYNKNIFVVPNALDDSLLRIRQIPPTPRNKTILWRGTITHNANLAVIQEQLIETAQKHSDWTFGFFGHEPSQITDRMPNYQTWDFHEIKDFFKVMCSIHPTAVYYSLSTNDHAQARSHVSWLEASFAGALYVGPDHPEFTRPGILNFKTPEEFQNILSAIMNNEVDVDKHVKESWDCILDNYILSKINCLRAQILRQMHAMIYPKAPATGA